MNLNKFEQAKNKLITEAQRVAGTYLLTKYSEAHLTGEPKVELTSTIDSNSSEIVFQGRITCFASGSLINPIIGVNLSVNSNDIEVESEESIGDRVENALNAQQELEPVKASLNGFKLTDNGSKYLQVAHSDLEDASLGIVAKAEYETSPNRSELLQTIIRDAMSRVANETTINFTGEFKEPVIEKKADDEHYCPECEKPNQFGEMCEKCKVDLENDAMSSLEVKQPKKSWLTADLEKEAVWIVEDWTGREMNFGEFPTFEDAWGFIREKFPEEDFQEYEVVEKESSQNLSIKENMPKATLSNKLSQDMQLEDQKLASANEKIKNEAVNALVSMLKSQGYGTAKVAEVLPSKSGFDIMTTVDSEGTIKAVNIPVEIKADKVVLPKRSLISELISKGLDINKKLSESFAQEVIQKMAAIEELENYKEAEATAILNERNTVTKTAGNNGFNSPQYVDSQDSITLQKHLLPSNVEWEKGMIIYADNQYWRLADMNYDQNSKGNEDASEWHFVKCEAPKDDKDVTNIKI